MPRHPLMPRHSLGARRGVRILAVLGLLVFSAAWARRRPGRPRSANRRWRRASCSAVTPGSGRGSRSRSTSRTTARRSAASCGWRAARRARPASAWRSTCPPQSDQVHVLYAQPPAFGTDLVGRSSSTVTRRSSTAKADLHQPRREPARRGRRRRASRSGSSATSISCRTRTRSRPRDRELAPEDLPDRVEAWGRRSTGSSGRTSTPSGCRRRSETRSVAGSPVADGWSSPAGRSARRHSRRSPTPCFPTGPSSPPTSPPATLSGILGQIPPGRRPPCRRSPGR